MRETIVDFGAAPRAVRYAVFVPQLGIEFLATAGTTPEGEFSVNTFLLVVGPRHRVAMVIPFAVFLAPVGSK